MISKFNGTSTPKGSYRAQTGGNDCNVNSSCYSLSTALCESIRYQAKSNKMSDKTWYPGCATRRLRSAPQKKIKPLCETRWVERHTAFRDFEDLYEALVVCMETIATNQGSRKWDAQAKTEANGFLHQLQSSTFIMAFQVTSFLLGYTKAISQSLQGRSMDVVEAYSQITLVKDQLQAVRKKAKTAFKVILTKQIKWRRSLARR